MNIYEQSYSLMNICIHLWTFMNIYEYLWTFKNIYERLWTFMNIYEQLWTFMSISSLLCGGKQHHWLSYSDTGFSNSSLTAFRYVASSESQQYSR